MSRVGRVGWGWGEKGGRGREGRKGGREGEALGSVSSVVGNERRG